MRVRGAVPASQGQERLVSLRVSLHGHAHPGRRQQAQERGREVSACSCGRWYSLVVLLRLYRIYSSSPHTGGVGILLPPRCVPSAPCVRPNKASSHRQIRVDPGEERAPILIMYVRGRVWSASSCRGKVFPSASKRVWPRLHTKGGASIPCSLWRRSSVKAFSKAAAPPREGDEGKGVTCGGGCGTTAVCAESMPCPNRPIYGNRGSQCQ